MIYCFDLDNTICKTIDKDYSNALPDLYVINSINQLYDSGNQIKIFTARGMGQFNGNIHKVYDYHYMATKMQLEAWNVKHHELILGKPSYDIFVDDKNMTVELFKKYAIRGVIAGAFDVIHPGYIHMFQEMSKLCTHLTVLLHTDPTLERPSKLKPILTIDERCSILSSIRYVDDVIVYNTEDELYEILKNSEFNIRFLGKDYLYSDYTGKDLPINIHFINRDHGWSSTKFKKLIASNI
jgi:glycerol-3-phosphate cytidylyltransferase